MTTDTGKLIAVVFVFVPLAVGFMGVWWLGSVANWTMEDVQSSRFNQRMRTHQQELMTQRDLDIMDGYGDGHVIRRAEFLEFMLVAAMNKIDLSLVDVLRKHFD
jgi:hypothetical protein